LGETRGSNTRKGGKERKEERKKERKKERISARKVVVQSVKLKLSLYEISNTKEISYETYFLMFIGRATS